MSILSTILKGKTENICSWTGIHKELTKIVVDYINPSDMNICKQYLDIIFEWFKDHPTLDILSLLSSLEQHLDYWLSKQESILKILSSSSKKYVVFDICESDWNSCDGSPPEGTQVVIDCLTCRVLAKYDYVLFNGFVGKRIKWMMDSDVLQMRTITFGGRNELVDILDIKKLLDKPTIVTLFNQVENC